MVLLNNDLLCNFLVYLPEEDNQDRVDYSWDVLPVDRHLLALIIIVVTDLPVQCL